MSVGSIIGGGIRLVRTQPQVVAIWAALYVLLAAIGMVAMRPFMASMLAFQQQMAAYQQQAAMARSVGLAAPPPPAIMGQMMSDIFGLDLIFLLLGIVAFAAVVRAVARPTGDRFAYLRVGMDELRLLGLGVLIVIAAIVIELVAILVAVLIGVLLSFVVGKAASGVAVAILMIALMCGGLYLEVRISLAGALTVLRGKIIIGEAWRATKGRFWTLFGVYVLLAIAYLILTILFVAIINPHLLAAYASMNSPAMMAAAQEQIAQQMAGFSPTLIVEMIVGAIIMVVFGSVAIGAIATAALELAPLDERA